MRPGQLARLQLQPHHLHLVPRPHQGSHPAICGWQQMPGCFVPHTLLAPALCPASLLFHLTVTPFSPQMSRCMYLDELFLAGSCPTSALFGFHHNSHRHLPRSRLHATAITFALPCYTRSSEGQGATTVMSEGSKRLRKKGQLNDDLYYIPLADNFVLGKCRVLKCLETILYYD